MLDTSQSATIDKLLDRFGITSSSPLPARSSNILRARAPEEERFEGRYREAVGGLLCIVNMSRPDVSNAISEVALYAHDPTAPH